MIVLLDTLETLGLIKFVNVLVLKEEAYNVVPLHNDPIRKKYVVSGFKPRTIRLARLTSVVTDDKVTPLIKLVLDASNSYPLFPVTVP